MTKLKKATVQIGNIFIDGYMSESGKYYMPSSAVGTIIGLSNRAYTQYLNRKIKSSSIKALTGEQISPQNGSSPSNGNDLTREQNIEKPKPLKVEGRAVRVTACTLDFVRAFWLEQLKKGNEIADVLVGALLEESLERRFDTAFDVKVTELERNQKIALRMKRVFARNEWTKQVKKILVRDSMYFDINTGEIADHVPALFSSLTVIVNQELFGVRDFGGNRDRMTDEQQDTIHSFEKALVNYSKHKPGIGAFQVVKDVLALPVW